MLVRKTVKAAVGIAALAILGLCLSAPTAASAKGKKPKNACSKSATAKSGALGGNTGQGDGAVQEVKAFVDALTCPQPGVPGQISVLGIALALDDNTQFEETTCSDLAALLTPGANILVEIDIFEDAATGALTATKVELEHGDQADQNDQGENEDGGGQGQDD